MHLEANLSTLRKNHIIRPDAKLFWACTAACMMNQYLNITMANELTYLLLLNCMIGLPHGASDYFWIKSQCQSIQKRILACLGYLAIVAVALSVWMMIPTVSLCLFLLLSAYHFGQDWQTQSNSERLLLGSAVLSIPVASDPASSQQLFHLVTLANSDLHWLMPSFKASYLLGMALTIKKIYQKNTQYLEVVALYGIGSLVSSLTFFTIYFCSLHSIRHYQQCAASITMENRDIIALSIIIIGTFCLLFWVHSSIELLLSNPQLSPFRSLFILLFALTVPHCCIVQLANKKQTLNQKQTG